MSVLVCWLNKEIQIVTDSWNFLSLKRWEVEKGFSFRFGQTAAHRRGQRRGQVFKCNTKNQVNVFHIRHDSCALWKTSAIISLFFYCPCCHIYTHTHTHCTHTHTLPHSESLPYTTTSFLSILSSSAAKIWCIGLQQTGMGMDSEQ